MSLSDILLPEFDQEMAITRRTLETIPDDRFDWAPHPKSMTIGRLANHMSQIAGWIPITLNQDSMDTAPVGQPPYNPPQLQTRAQILEAFDKNVRESRAALAAATDEIMAGTWTLMHAGQVFFSLPKSAVLRTWVFNHMVHHRAQLGVSLRLNDVSVPSVYGPSADEGMSAG